ncbi:hypothetical protein ACFQVA_14075 [Actinomadura keratinilytica]
MDPGTLLRAVENGEGRVPALVCADDADQWPPTARRLLGEAAERLSEAGGGLLLTAATHRPLPGELASLPVVHLDPLAPEEAAALLAEAARETVEPSVAAALIAEGEGNPALLHALVRHLSPAALRGRAPLPRPSPTRQPSRGSRPGPDRPHHQGRRTGGPGGGCHQAGRGRPRRRPSRPARPAPPRPRHGPGRRAPTRRAPGGRRHARVPQPPAVPGGVRRRGPGRAAVRPPRARRGVRGRRAPAHRPAAPVLVGGGGAEDARLAARLAAEAAEAAGNEPLFALPGLRPRRRPRRARPPGLRLADPRGGTRPERR